MADAQALIVRQGELLCAQPLMRHLEGSGTLAQAETLTSHLSLLVLWLGDLFRFARERATDPQVSARLAETSIEAAARAARFRTDLEALGLFQTGQSLYTAEHALIREVAFARVADVISSDHDCVRLGIALSVSATTELLFEAGLAFARRVKAGSAALPNESSNQDRFKGDSEPQLATIHMPDAVAREVYAAIDRCFESVLRVVTGIDRVTFGS